MLLTRRHLLLGAASMVAIDPPYRLDPLQNIVNVHWQGLGVFVTGDSAGPIRRYKDNGAGKEWDIQDIGTTSFTADGGTLASSYHKVENPPGTKTSVFLMGGFIGYFDSFESFSVRALIERSTDGVTWTSVFQEEQDPDDDDSAVLGLVWNDVAKKFYADIVFSQGGIGHPIFTFERVYESIDGLSWSLTEEVDLSLALEENTYPEGVIYNKYMPDRNNAVPIPPGSFGFEPYQLGVPDGVFARKEILDESGQTKEITMIPREPFIYQWGNSIGYRPCPVLKVKNTKTGEEFETAAGMVSVTNVAVVGSTWLAAGHTSIFPSIAALSYSRDDGHNWTILDQNPDNRYETLSGGTVIKNTP